MRSDACPSPPSLFTSRWTGSRSPRLRSTSWSPTTSFWHTEPFGEFQYVMNAASSFSSRTRTIACVFSNSTGGRLNSRSVGGGAGSSSAIPRCSQAGARRARPSAASRADGRRRGKAGWGSVTHALDPDVHHVVRRVRVVHTLRELRVLEAAHGHLHAYRGVLREVLRLVEPVPEDVHLAHGREAGVLALPGREQPRHVHVEVIEERRAGVAGARDRGAVGLVELERHARIDVVRPARDDPELAAEELDAAGDQHRRILGVERRVAGRRGQDLVGGRADALHLVVQEEPVRIEPEVGGLCRARHEPEHRAERDAVSLQSIALRCHRKAARKADAVGLWSRAIAVWGAAGLVSTGGRSVGANNVRSEMPSSERDLPSSGHASSSPCARGEAWLSARAAVPFAPCMSACVRSSRTSTAGTPTARSTATRSPSRIWPSPSASSPSGRPSITSRRTTCVRARPSSSLTWRAVRGGCGSARWSWSSRGTTRCGSPRRSLSWITSPTVA